MQSFIKIGGVVSEKKSYKKHTDYWIHFLTLQIVNTNIALGHPLLFVTDACCIFTAKQVRQQRRKTHFVEL